jgi:hypothetical protein
MKESDGSIIAAIITIHIPINPAAALSQLCPVIPVQTIDELDPLAIDIPPDRLLDQITVPTALTANRSALIAKNTRSDARPARSCGRAAPRLPSIIC